MRRKRKKFSEEIFLNYEINYFKLSFLEGGVIIKIHNLRR